MLRACRTSTVTLAGLVVAVESQRVGIATLAQGLEAHGAALAETLAQVADLLEQVRALEGT